MPVYKDKKRGTWYCRFRYTDWRGKRIETTKRGFLTKRDAKEYEESAKKKQSAAALTFRELYGIYMQDMKNRLKKTTMHSKQAIAEKHLLPYFGDLELDKITPITIRQWQAEILRARTPQGKPYSAAYMRLLQAYLSGLLSYAVKYYGLPKNPIKIAGSIAKTETKDMMYWTAEEFSQFMSYEQKPMYRAIFLILFWCGLRRGEVLALTGEDIDADRKTIRINKSYSRLKGREDVIALPKTAKSVRTITAPSVVINAVQTYLATLYKYDGKARMFPIYIHGIGEELARVCSISGVKKIRVHDLRHSHASYLINKNVPVKLISQRLGHESVETTLRIYAHIYKDTEDVVSDMIETDSSRFCGQNAVIDKKAPPTT